jgi:hypothetical protein
MEAIPEASDPTGLALITRLALSTKKHDVDSTTYVLVWLSDISQLEWMVDRSTSSLYEIQEILSQYKGYQLRDSIEDEMDSNDPNNQNWTPEDLQNLTPSSAEEERGRKRVRHS